MSDDLRARLVLLEARTVVLELMLRTVFTMGIHRAKDPMRVLDGFTREFEQSIAIIDFGLDDDSATQLRRSLRKIFDDNLAAVAARVQVPAQQEAERHTKQ